MQKTKEGDYLLKMVTYRTDEAVAHLPFPCGDCGKDIWVGDTAGDVRNKRGFGWYVCTTCVKNYPTKLPPKPFKVKIKLGLDT